MDVTQIKIITRSCGGCKSNVVEVSVKSTKSITKRRVGYGSFGSINDHLSTYVSLTVVGWMAASV